MAAIAVFATARQEVLDGVSTMAWLAGALPGREGGPKTFIVHGENQPAATLKARIRRDLEWSEVTVPVEGAVHEL